MWTNHLELRDGTEIEVSYDRSECPGPQLYTAWVRRLSRAEAVENTIQGKGDGRSPDGAAGDGQGSDVLGGEVGTTALIDPCRPGQALRYYPQMRGCLHAQRTAESATRTTSGQTSSRANRHQQLSLKYDSCVCSIQVNIIGQAC